MKLPYLTQHKTTIKSGGDTAVAVKQWLFLLFVGLVLFSVAGVYSVWRFNYWSQINETVSAEDVIDMGYNKKSFDSIVETIKSNEVTRNELLNVLSESNSVATTTNLESASSTDELIIIGVTSDEGE